jgi:hypothetical protein
MPNKTTTADTTALLGDCTCKACKALLGECGPSLFPFYRGKLLQRGWAGRVTDTERSYQRAHADWMKKAVSEGVKRAARQGWAGSRPSTAKPSHPGK